jgi:hypothetical protein
MSGVSHMLRVRWAAIGAALAVSLGAGGIGIVNATISSGSKAVYVPITPCRLADTRPAPDTVGSKNTPIGAGQTHTFTVRGVNGNCTIPAGATAIVANVTAVAPTAQSFMAIWPADKPQPNASSLNYSAGQAAVPNAVTVTLSGDGKIKAFNKNGNVNVIIDIAGYYEDHDHDDRYYTKGQIDVIPSGVTVTGYQLWDLQATGPDGDYRFSVPLPAKAPVALTDTEVNFSPTPLSVIGDGDPSCTGNPDAPMAPPGKVCLYLASNRKVTNVRGIGSPVGDGGFRVGWSGLPTTVVNEDMYVGVVWAYTAP